MEDILPNFTTHIDDLIEQNTKAITRLEETTIAGLHSLAIVIQKIEKDSHQKENFVRFFTHSSETRDNVYERNQQCLFGTRKNDPNPT